MKKEKSDEKYFEEVIVKHLNKKRKIGGKIHKILNNTIHRKLTIQEYGQVVTLIKEFGVDVFENEKLRKHLKQR